jgi:hypothetical protein
MGHWSPSFELIIGRDLGTRPNAIRKIQIDLEEYPTVPQAEFRNCSFKGFEHLKELTISSCILWAWCHKGYTISEFLPEGLEQLTIVLRGTDFENNVSIRTALQKFVFEENISTDDFPRLKRIVLLHHWALSAPFDQVQGWEPPVKTGRPGAVSRVQLDIRHWDDIWASEVHDDYRKYEGLPAFM